MVDIQDTSEQIEANPRYMWRFMCYRTTEPGNSTIDNTNENTTTMAAVKETTERQDHLVKEKARAVLDTWVGTVHGTDEITGAVLAPDGEAEPLYSVWESVLGWTLGQSGMKESIAGASEITVVNSLAAQLRSKGAENEPTRISAAYKLGALCNATFSGSLAVMLPTQAAAAAVATLSEAMTHSWEGVRRAACHGLIASGGHCSAAERALLQLCVRVYLLGSIHVAYCK